MTSPCPEPAPAVAPGPVLPGLGAGLGGAGWRRVVPTRAGWRRLGLTLAALAVVAAAAAIGHRLSERQGVSEAQVEARHQLALFASAVDGVIKRLERVPATIQLSHEVLALLRQPADPHRVHAATVHLRRLNAHLGSIAAFVLNDRGVVLASSHSEPGDDSTVGEDLSFRPYFLEALSGRVGRHFAIGIGRGQPGYFVSHPIHDGSRVVGVAAIKISLEPIEQGFSMLGSPALLADTNGVVVLASNPAWRYTALTALPLERRVDLQLSRVYNNKRLPRFPLAGVLPLDADGQLPSDPVSRTIDAALPMPASGMLVTSRVLDGMDWRLVLLRDLDAVRRQALVSALSAAGVAGFVVLLLLHLAQRRRIVRGKLQAKRLLERANAELEHNVARRTQDLTETNARLRVEIAEREQAETSLRAAQSELIQTAKVAVLGRLATGITHELTQPLGAIRTLSGNALEFLKRGDAEAAAGNLDIIARLADRMGALIQPLKGFARKSQPEAAAVDVAQAVRNALFLFEPALRRAGIEVDDRSGEGGGMAWCDANRLEQVLVNLIGNAIDAMADAPLRRLTLSVESRALPGQGAQVRIEVLDTGCGLSETARAQLFEPFFTTKPRGAGLGLGLAISRDIVRGFGGEIEAFARPEGGTCFRLRLPAAPLRLAA